jgi:hypothetical protein
MTRAVIVILLVAACGGKQTTGPGTGSATGSAEPVGVVKDTRTPIEKRRDEACDTLGPRLTRCSVDDARAKLADGKITKQQFDADTKPDLQRALTADWVKKCKVDMSSRQVRVLEVCLREETECGPLQDCLLNLQPKTK